MFTVNFVSIATAINLVSLGNVAAQSGKAQASNAP